MRELLRRAWYIIRQRRFEADLAEEIEFHRAMAQRDLEAHGLDHTEAGQAAHRLVGNATLAREESRGVWVWPWLESLWQDAAYAMRNLRRQPGFTTVVVIVLATVIGLHTTLVTVIAGVVLRPWPGVRDGARVVTIYLVGQTGEAGRFPLFPLDAFRSLSDHTTSLSGVTASMPDDLRIGSGDSAQTTAALLVSGNFFDLLGIAVAPGRGFAADEDHMGRPQAVVVLAHDFWQSRFGGDPAIVGNTVRINDVPFTVVGVASREFGSAEPAYGKQLFVPIASVSLLRPTEPPPTCCVDVAGRLAVGATREQTRAEMSTLLDTLALQDGSKPRSAIVTGTEFASRPGRADAVGPLAAVAAIFAGLLLVWLIACANIGNLLLARAAARVHEIGIRLSLGASRRRLIRQLLTEGFVLALGGSALGIGIAYKLPFLILHFLGGTTAVFPFRIAVDGVVLGCAVLLAGISAAAFGLAPALYATRPNIATSLNEREGLPVSRFSLRGLLLGVQVAVSVVLLVSASLLVRGAQRAGFFDPGFSVNDVTAVSFDLPPGTYDDARKRAFFSDLTEALRVLPAGVIEAFGFATWEPTFIRRGYATPVRLPNQTPAQARILQYIDTSPDYLNVLKIPIVAGRNFEPSDTTRPVVVINEAMARQYWPDESPVGKTFLLGRGESREIIGVMRDAHTHSMGTVPPLFYQPLRGGRVVPRLLIRSSKGVPTAELKRIVAGIDPRVRIQTTPLSAHLEARVAESKWGPMLAAVLGAFALALATVGMFGVFAYAVRQRTREIGIRMALGAQPSAVVRLVLAGHSRAVLAGLVVGLFGAVASSIIMRSRLHGLSPFDPVAYLGVAAVLTVAGLAASYVPARRATRVDPVVALRYE
jgi:macrolide transport system ATP-binding/permease protein